MSTTEPSMASPQSPTEYGTPRQDVNDALPLPNDPVDATGLLTAEDLTGEAPD